MLFALSPIHFVAQFRRDPMRVFDQVSIKIDDVECTVRPCCSEDAMEPAVRRSEKLFVRVRIFGHETRTAWRENTPLDDVLHRLADTIVFAVFRRPRRASRYARPTRAGEMSDRLRDQQRR